MKCCCLFLLYTKILKPSKLVQDGIVSHIHVQVLTRFICSSSPVIYWFAADVLKQTLKPSDLRALESSDVTALLTGVVKTLVSSSSCWSSKLIIAYFFLYVVLGYILHCNFYPWTQAGSQLFSVSCVSVCKPINTHMYFYPHRCSYLFKVTA